MEFLDKSRDKKVNETLLFISRQAVVDGAVNEQVIADNDLAMIPEAVSILVRLAGASRDDIYKYTPETGIQFPMIQNVFCYNFAKGVESAYLWNLSSGGKFSLNYNPEDAVRGLVGAEVSTEFQGHINDTIPLMSEVFCDFQDQVITNPKYNFTDSGRWLADGIACGLFWASQVGIDYGMEKLGFK